MSYSNLGFHSRAFSSFFPSRLKVALILITSLTLLLFSLTDPALAAGKDDKANRMVSGIISFTRWPALKDAPQLCVFSSARHLNFPVGPTTTSLAFSVIYLNSDNELGSKRCDAIYFGDQSPQQQTVLLASKHGKAVLSLSENNPDCAVGAAFC